MIILGISILLTQGVIIYLLLRKRKPEVNPWLKMISDAINSRDDKYKM